MTVLLVILLYRLIKLPTRNDEIIVPSRTPRNFPKSIKEAIMASTVSVVSNTISTLP